MILQPGTYAILNDDLSFREVRTFTEQQAVKDGRARPVVMTAQPAFNAATQKVIQNGWTIIETEANPVWQVVALTQAELDVISQASEAVIIKQAIATFGAGTATNAQIQRALTYLLKQSLG